MKETVRRFLSGEGVDNRGRSLASVLRWSDDALEFHHDFIQWLFPLEQASRFNPDAPVLAPRDFAELGKDPRVLDGLRAAFSRMLGFYGLAWDGTKVVKAENWRARSPNWALTPTHNDLRITRILRSLALFGLHEEAAAFLAFLETLLGQKPSSSHRSAALPHWQKAVAVSW
ncbi:MAG: hypothetical protein JWQ00_1016 [Noviherbaspirillum sp.]|jgi:hypothetical protein|nr:hypothetical protein [Noviherbaspirillum sp.]